MKLILHIGMPKTGTTALQAFMAKNRSRLKMRGVLYPRVNISPVNHNFLSLFLRQHQCTPRKFLSIYRENPELMMRDAELNWQQIKQQVNKFKPSVLVLSGEQIFRGFEVGDVSAFKSRLQELTDDIQIYLYVRRPSADYLSRIQQSLKASSHIAYPGNFFCQRAIEAIETGFKITPVLIEYDRTKLHNGDIKSDFIQRILPDITLELDYSDSSAVNETLSAESMAIMQDFRLINYPHSDNLFTRDSQILVKTLQNIETTYKLNKRPELIKEVADSVDYSSIELKFLKNNYGIQFSGIDYDAIAKFEFNMEIPRSIKVADICIIDESRKRKILMLTLKELTKSRQVLPDSWQIWLQRKTGNTYVQWMLSLKSFITQMIRRISNQ